MIVVHHLNNSRSQRVLWLLEELGLPYEVKRYERDAATMLAPPELKAIHPLGKSPVITDGDRTIAETGAIIEYVLETYGAGRLIPSAGSAERLRYTYWLHYAEGSAMTPLLLKLVFTALPTRTPLLLRGLVKAIAGAAQSSFIDPQIRLHVDYWEAELAATGWFAGPDFTAADIAMSFPLEAGASRAGDLTTTRNH
jgi:glutathione S-transferase